MNNRSLRSTTEWGPSYWYVLHTSSFSYPLQPTSTHKKNTIDFLNLLPSLLPCPNCQNHAREFIQKSNLQSAVQSREKLIEFYVTFHNAVNSRLNKPQVSLEQAKNMYHHLHPSWGPPYWFFFHMTALTYKESPTTNERIKMQSFLEMCYILLPTWSAQQVTSNYMKAKYEQLVWACLNKSNLFFFWYTFHNYINKTLGRSELSFERVKDMYRIN
jgi:hypothetical protein